MKELSDLTAMKATDVVDTLMELGLIRYREGQHFILQTPRSWINISNPPAIVLSLMVAN
ncbi:hypothetical protein HHK36_008023 [Tetracentron sinense]|uniref:Uncharacterized protein n=1 Tax=Tetracentron sinense TaxID=13715 RepID=A0A834ZHP6_TETSI|nr:hypothetical protein HHK36_008023 [Tetracentron sinense]